MKTFKQTISENQFGRILDLKIFDPKDPQIVIIGFGSCSLSFAKKDIERRLREIADQYKRGELDAKGVDFLTGDKSILKLFCRAVQEVEQQLQTPDVKRRITIMSRK